MAENGNGGRHRMTDMRFKWLVVSTVFVIAMVLGTIQQVMK